MTTKTLPELAGDFRITVRAAPFSIAIPAQNQTISAFSSARNPRQSKIKAAITVAIQICLEKILETFGLLDFAVLVVMPVIIAVLRYRYDEQGDNAEVEADDLSTEVNEVSLLQCFRKILTEGWLSVSKLTESGQSFPKRRADDEDFVYLNQRPSARPNVCLFVLFQ